MSEINDFIKNVMENSDGSEVRIGDFIIKSDYGKDAYYVGEGGFVDIPEEIDERTWLRFQGSKNITAIKIPNTISTVNAKIFSETEFGSVESLEEVIFPDGFCKIAGNGCFANFPKLEKVNLPESLEYLDYGAFKNTPFMENNLENIGGCHYLGNFLVSSDKNIENAVIREGTKMICAWAFKSRKNLQSVTFPASVKIIGEQAFCGCEKLREIRFPSGGLKVIEDSAFTGCIGVNKIDIPDSSSRISDIAFISNTGKKVLYPDYAYIPGIDPKSCNTIQAEFYTDCYATSFELHSAEEQRIYDEHIIKHKSKNLVKLLEPSKLGYLNKIGSKLLTAKNIDDLIDAASKNKNTEAVAFLMNWKEEHKLYTKAKKGEK